MTLGYFLKKNGISISKAAGLLDIHRNYLSLILKGKRHPSLVLAQGIEDLTHGEIKANELLRKKDSEIVCECCKTKLYDFNTNKYFNNKH